MRVYVHAPVDGRVPVVGDDAGTGCHHNRQGNDGSIGEHKQPMRRRTQIVLHYSSSSSSGPSSRPPDGR